MKLLLLGKPNTNERYYSEVFLSSNILHMLVYLILN